MRTRTSGPGVKWIAAALLAATVAGCATFDRTGDPRYPGYARSGVRVAAGAPTSFEPNHSSHRPDDVDREVRERVARHDFRFKAWMSDPATGRAFFPGISEAQGARLDRSAAIEVESIRYAEIFPMEMDAYSRRAQYDGRFSYLARFNQDLFRALDRLGIIAPSKSP